MAIKVTELDRSNREEGQDWSKFYFCSKRYSRRFAWLYWKVWDEEASMLWFDGKGVGYFKESSTGVAEDT